jgi:hypothetical protein
MNSGNFKFVVMVFALALLLPSIATAERIDQGDIPEPCVVCTGVELKYADVDTCWPGNKVSVPVYYTSADTLEYLQIWGTLPAGLTYDSCNIAGTPWSGSIIDTSTSGTIEIHLLRGGTLPPDTLARVLDVVLDISDSFSFDTSFTIKFGHNIAAQIKGDLYDCDVTDTTSGTITIPNDSVVVTFDSVLAYSYQAADSTDQAKLDNPLKVPVKLYTNFPCSTYVIWFDVLDSLDYIGLDTLIAGVQVTRYGVTDSLKIHGTLPSKPGNDSTYYLCDLKFEVGNFKYRYDASQTFDTTLFLGFPASGVIPPWTHVSNWGTNDTVPYDSITKVSEGIYLPVYGVSLDIKNASVDENGQVEVPVACSTTFWAQYNSLNIGYDSTLLTFTGIDSTGGHIPPIGDVDSYPHSGNYAIRQFQATYADSGLYILPDVGQVLFKLKFDADPSFYGGMTTDIMFFTGQANNSKVYDFFSPSGEANKIIRDETDTQVWSTSNGTVTNPEMFEISVGGPTYYEKNVVKLEIDVENTNLDSVDRARLMYSTDTPVADSLTVADFGLNNSDAYVEGDSVILELGFDELVRSSATLVYVWITSEEPGEFWIIESEGCFVQYIFEGNEYPFEVTFVGDPVYYEWEQPKLITGLPDAFTLSQNYPNPFNAQTNISFNLGTPGLAELKVFDILGRQITTLVSEELPAGEHIINWDGANAAGKPIAGGVYFYVLKAGEFRESKKMLYLK